MKKINLLLLPLTVASLGATKKQIAQVCELSLGRKKKEVVLSEAHIQYSISLLGGKNYTSLLKNLLSQPLKKKLTLRFRMEEGIHSSPYRKKQLYKNMTGVILKKAIAKQINKKMQHVQISEKYIALYLYSKRQNRFFIIPTNRLKERLIFLDKKYRNKEGLKNYRYDMLYFPQLKSCHKV